MDGTDSGGALQSIATPITGEDVVAHLMAYIQNRNHLEENAAFLGVKGKPEAEQRQSLQALVEDAQETMMTAGVATQAMDLRQFAASIAYYGYLQMTQKDGLLRRWTTWLHRRREYSSVGAMPTKLPLHSKCPPTT